MTDQEKQNSVRRHALEKYKNYVESELNRLNDGCMDGTRLRVTEFEPEPPIKDGYESEELKEIEYFFGRLKDIKALTSFCEYNGIKLKKYTNIIWN